jgi:endonuclease III
MAKKTTRPAAKAKKRKVASKGPARAALKAAKAGKAAKPKSAKAQVEADVVAAHGDIQPWTRAEAMEAFRRFQSVDPAPKGELQHVNPFTLLVAVVLSAQATDAGVNKATPALFAAADTPEKMIALGEAQVRDFIKTIGLYRNKARHLIRLCEALVERHGGLVPAEREALEALPGVGRKTANVVLNTAFGQPTIAVDTHIFRLGNRTGLAPGKTPLAVEQVLLDRVPERFRLHAHHWLILHGRYVCKARRPECWRCAVADLCRYEAKVPAPPARRAM